MYAGSTSHSFIRLCYWLARDPAPTYEQRSEAEISLEEKDSHMAKASRGGRMTAAKKRAAKTKGGKGPVKKRPAGVNIMKT